MAINLSLTNSQASELRAYASQLKSLRAKLLSTQDMLNRYWQSKEVIYINQAIREIDKRLFEASNMLESLNSSIRSAAQDIYREEEAARIARERAARERAERERAAREAAAREAAAREAAAKEAAEKAKSQSFANKTSWDIFR